ncbi:MAG: cytidylyltransferase domain-containing protein, partial [Promethearchaeota archaeon]
MDSKNKIFLGIITARGGSKGLPRKNIKSLAGRPLIHYTFQAAKASKLMNRCIVSSEDEEIINFSINQNMEVPFIRPAELANDEVKSIDVLIHAMQFLREKEGYKPDYIITLQPTSPLRTGIDIDNSIKLIINNPEADSLVSVIQAPHNFNPYSIMKLNVNYIEHFIKMDKEIMRRQEKPIFYARNGAAIYISSYNLIMKQKKIIGENCLAYIMPKERSIDIDDYYDWEIAEFLIKKNQS